MLELIGKKNRDRKEEDKEKVTLPPPFTSREPPQEQRSNREIFEEKKRDIEYIHQKVKEDNHYRQEEQNRRHLEKIERENRFLEEQEQFKLEQRRKERSKDSRQPPRITLPSYLHATTSASGRFLRDRPSRDRTAPHASPSLKLNIDEPPQVQPAVQTTQPQVEEHTDRLVKEEEQPKIVCVDSFKEGFKEDSSNINKINNLDLNVTQDRPIEDRENQLLNQTEINPQLNITPLEENFTSSNLENFEEMAQEQLLTAIAHLIQTLNNNNQGINNNNVINNQQGVNASKISIQIPIFRGDPRESVTAWLLQVETVFDAQGIPADQTDIRINYATTGMRDAALSWW
jgi:hypothetical protein